jgi:hypothetical protein
MKSVAILLSAVVLLVSPIAARAGQGPASGAGACATVQQALADSRSIAPGVTRKEVEKYFTNDGGMQFPPHTRYTYRQCNYIKLEVDFDPAPSPGKDFTSPDDKVKNVSKLYIDYPAKD